MRRRIPFYSELPHLSIFLRHRLQISRRFLPKMISHPSPWPSHTVPTTTISSLTIDTSRSSDHPSVLGGKETIFPLRYPRTARKSRIAYNTVRSQSFTGTMSIRHKLALLRLRHNTPSHILLYDHGGARVSSERTLATSARNR